MIPISYVNVMMTLDYIIIIIVELTLKMMYNNTHILYNGNDDFGLHNCYHG